MVNTLGSSAHIFGLEEVVYGKDEAEYHFVNNDQAADSSRVLTQKL
jgi:hypothetical protein